MEKSEDMDAERPLIQRLIARIQKFLNEDIWLDDKETSGMMKHLKGASSKIYLAVSLFIQKELLFYAASLAFNTVLAIVPLVALFFAISRGFGYSGIIEDMINSLLSSQPEAARYIIQFANSYLSNAKSSAIIGFGVVVMLYSVISLINNIETVFNSIWNVKESRQFTRKVMNYLSMFFMVPITIVIVSGINLAVNTYINEASSFEFLAPLLKTLIRLIPIAVTTIVFTVIFVTVPNTKVRVRAAIIPGLLTAIFMQMLQQAYVFGQTFLSSYNAIYGSLAALPLFMLWVQFSWYIILFFAELSYTSQNRDFFVLRMNKDDLSQDEQVLLSALLLSLIFRKFSRGEDHYTALMLKKETGIPVRLIAEMLNDLCDARILQELNEPDIEEPTYTPYEDIANITLGRLIQKLGSYSRHSSHDIDLLSRLHPQALADIRRIHEEYIKSMGKIKIEDLWNG